MNFARTVARQRRGSDTYRCLNFLIGRHRVSLRVATNCSGHVRLDGGYGRVERTREFHAVQSGYSLVALTA